jgi:hypothetical protein
MSATTSATRTIVRARVQSQFPLGQMQPPAMADWSAHHRLPEVLGKKALATANAFLRNEPNLDGAFRPNEPNADCSVFAKRTQPPATADWSTHHRLPEVLGKKALATANAFLRNEPNRDRGIRPNEPNADCSVFTKRTQLPRLLWQFPFFGPSLGQYERRRGSIRRRDE